MCSCSTKGWASLVIEAEGEKEGAGEAEAEVTGEIFYTLYYFTKSFYIIKIFPYFYIIIFYLYNNICTVYIY